MLLLTECQKASGTAASYEELAGQTPMKQKASLAVGTFVLLSEFGFVVAELLLIAKSWLG